MKAIFRAIGGDGFISPKLFIDGAFVGYDLTRLSTGEAMPLARVAGTPYAARIEGFAFGRFVFSDAAFDYAENIYDEMIAANIAPIFIDEIGPIELDGGGFDRIFRRLSNFGRDVYAVIGKSCLEGALLKYEIEARKTIYISDGGKA